MQCSCGSETTSSSHKVTTIKKALEWSDKVDESELPIRVDSDTCRGCGRSQVSIYNNAIKLIDKRG